MHHVSARVRSGGGSPPVGVISDTHGLVRPEALRALAGCGLIIHAGDVGTPAVLEALARVAPVVAVRGNNDVGAWVRALPARDTVRIGRFRFLVLHDLADLAVDPAVAGVDAVICGHSHRPALQRHGGVLYLNPGSAGPRRFALPITVARVQAGTRGLRARILHLDTGPRPQ